VTIEQIAKTNVDAFAELTLKLSERREDPTPEPEEITNVDLSKAEIRGRIRDPRDYLG
jgi:hypothetical protein